MSKETVSKAQAVRTLYESREKTAGEIGKLLGISRATVYRYLASTPVESTPVQVIPG